ncbi:hypothetical protein E1293_07610 [Actinomadura darangshiensis]|uniref:Uncharacterized protein n=1 Tax=Actinomadura darangshiensis TaxID=705336 RepID=A0A4R5BQI4_9ACTN|nr:glycosyltransferase family 2 protein [Actinomadura darangshiensis]TDD87673.1 hypothetical protein E1293_07610 [Actinomadura darangshiensis]
MKVAATQGLPFGDGPEPGILDVPAYLLDAAMARARRRNPAATPWWRRYVRTWQTFSPREAVPGPTPLVYGLTMAWNEDDVIYATVRNLFLQGADEVFVIDDASDDDTVAEAVSAGGTVIRDVSDGTFDERRRSARISQLIDQRTEAAGRPVWWVVVDADEFPRGPGGSTIRDLAHALPPWVDTVGSRVLEHYPSRSSAPERRHHPLDELQNARWHSNPSCPAGHWKHQMLLMRAPGELQFMPGRHAIAAPSGRRPVAESEASLLMHHFPLRGREWTERKFRLAASDTGRYTMSSDEFIKKRLDHRLRMLDLAYDEQYHLLPNMFPGEPKQGVRLSDWRDLVPTAEQETPHKPGAPL